VVSLGFWLLGAYWVLFKLLNLRAFLLQSKEFARIILQKPVLGCRSKKQR
jgi:hypothetical protein